MNAHDLVQEIIERKGKILSLVPKFNSIFLYRM